MKDVIYTSTLHDTLSSYQVWWKQTMLSPWSGLDEDPHQRPNLAGLTRLGLEGQALQVHGAKWRQLSRETE